MISVTITIDQAAKLIAALNRLAEVLENNPSSMPRHNEPTTSTSEDTSATETEQNEDKPVTLEQVRAVLAAKSQAGKKAEVGQLLQKYGATKLTAIDPAKFANLIKDAESL